MLLKIDKLVFDSTQLFTVTSHSITSFIIGNRRWYNESQNKRIAEEICITSRLFQTRVVLLSGGIGVTPFRSMIKYATDKTAPTKNSNV
jgi:NAD(P)H-flavin reductase